MGILSSYPGGSKSLLIFSGKIDEMGIADYYSFGKIRPGFQPIEVYNLPRIWIDWNSLGGGFKYFLFSPPLGKIPNLTNIFQTGWNHQLE